MHRAQFLLLVVVLLAKVCSERQERRKEQIRQLQQQDALLLLRSVLRVGVPRHAPSAPAVVEPVALARSTEHALRSFCALNDVAALPCAGLMAGAEQDANFIFVSTYTQPSRILKLNKDDLSVAGQLELRTLSVAADQGVASNHIKHYAMLARGTWQ